jgi:hypothetical protein
VRRVARPGALCALVTYNLMNIEPAIDEYVRHFHDVVLGEYWPPERASVIAGYRDIDFPFAELTMPALEIALEWNFEELMNYLDTWSGIKAAEKVLPESPRVAFRRDVAPLWGDPAVRRTVRWPLTVRCGRVELRSSGRTNRQGADAAADSDGTLHTQFSAFSGSSPDLSRRARCGSAQSLNVRSSPLAWL